MTDLDLDEIRARAEKATAGPWLFYPTPGRKDIDDYEFAWTVTRPDCDKNFGEPCAEDCGADVLVTGHCDDDHVTLDDAAFIAHAREDVPALVAEVERLRQSDEAIRRDERRRLAELLNRDADTIGKFIGEGPAVVRLVALMIGTDTGADRALDGEEASDG